MGNNASGQPSIASMLDREPVRALSITEISRNREKR